MSRAAVANAALEQYKPPNARAIEIARLYAEEGLTYAQIGERYGISRQRVEQILRPFGIPAHWGKANRTAREQRLREAFDSVREGRETMKEAAERLGYASRDSLWAAMAELGLDVPRRQPAAHGGARRYQMGCKCDACMEGMRARARARRGQEPREHGTNSSYTNYSCRCQACTEAATIYRRGLRARRKQQRQPVD
jgi:AraC-like DNA-binding protein